MLFCFQDVLEIVDSSVEGLAANATEVQRVAHKALKKNIFGHIKHFLNEAAPVDSIFVFGHVDWCCV